MIAIFVWTFHDILEAIAIAIVLLFLLMVAIISIFQRPPKR